MVLYFTSLTVNDFYQTNWISKIFKKIQVDVMTTNKKYVSYWLELEILRVIPQEGIVFENFFLFPRKLCVLTLRNKFFRKCHKTPAARDDIK